MENQSEKKCNGYEAMFTFLSEEDFKEHLYYLDMTVFKAVIDELKFTGFSPEIVDDGLIEGIYHSGEDGYLLLSVPYDSGWKITVNDLPVNVQKGINTFLTIPVKQGENRIQCMYKTPGVSLGIMFSGIGLLSLIFLEVHRKKQKS